MTTETILVANVKCNGCATTIKNELQKIEGVSDVTVDKDADSITLSYPDDERKMIIDRLHELGYPEATEKNGLLLQLKSYASCMVGRIHNLQA